jgi:hypothetical protein
MSTQAMSFSGVAPNPTPVPDRGASAFYGPPSFPQSHPVAGFGPLTQAIRLSSCIFSHGEGGWRGGH